MGSYLLCLFIFRIILPILLSICIVFRPSGLSVLYFIFLLILPMVPVPTTQSMMGKTGIYLKFMIALSVLTALCQLTFQITLLALPPYGHFLNNCTILEKSLRHGGFVRLDDADAVTILTWISPEVIMVATAIVCFLAFKRLTVISLEPEDGSTESAEKKKNKHFGMLVAIGRYIVLITFCLAAVLRPSAIGGLYFLIFLSTATWWACYKQLRKGFAIFLRIMMFIVALHMLVFYAYQFQWPQEFLPPTNQFARYFGLKTIYNVTCDGDPRKLNWVPQEIATYIFPVALYWLYYICALESKGLLQPQVKSHSESAMIGETTPLIRGVSSSSEKYGTTRRAPPSLIQDSTGSVTITGDNTEDIPMEQLGKGTTEEEYNPTTLDKVIYVLESLLQVIIKSSYIVTNIIMMAWSITYLSWITFVLLIWSNILWLVPNQRKSMLRSSPFLVAYAMFLLISAYVYSMDLTDAELPVTVRGYNMSQIGFTKEPYMPCNALIVKCLFTGMFWITLRQWMQERIARRQSSALADMVAPLQVTVGTATGVNKEQEESNKLMDKLGRILKSFLTKFWIWVVAGTLFAVAITGDKMTGFRVCYMALFLFFILTFQLSFRCWRKMMFGFWLVVIIYSMIILVMVYTYQFQNIPEYWKKYLNINKEQQADIGLEVFDIKQLFVRLLTPTAFVIITVIQLHYFHKDFMELSDPKNVAPPANSELENSSLQGGAVVERRASVKEDLTLSSSSGKYDLSGIEKMTSMKTKTRLQTFLKCLHNAVNVLFLFLELHMPKVVILFAMFLCIYDSCSFYMIIVILIVVSFLFGRGAQIFSIYTTSVLVSLLILARMLYQIKYIEPANWDVVCVINNTNYTFNDADWFGLPKTQKLSHLLKWNIIYIIVVTVWAVVLVRQYNYRVSRGKPTTRAFFMFPRITRTDADKNLTNMIKYLFNYGFYKFGVEISLMATVGLIGFRMDMYAVIYSIWLCILFALKRETLSKIWIFYQVFIAFFLVVQYFMAVGLPPSLCTKYPWQTDDFYRSIQEWAFLLDYESPPVVKKLLCDFFVLLFVSRQAVVFRIEKRYADQEYAGGSNKVIIHLYEDKDFVNPMPDFVTYVRSYLDVFKRGALMSFLWITLAIVFLAGTNRVNIFSLGYLVGAFIFLWKGSDIYLKPVPVIVRSWNWLLGYNVVVILVKALLQIVGCIFDEEVSTPHLCWIKQLFGIGCVKKFFNENLTPAGATPATNECEVPREYVGLVWDGLCFGFLIMMRRIYHSYNFFHMINEVKASTILASRGAELIEELRIKQMIEQEEEERKVLEKIKAKMDRIKATQQKIQGASYKDSTNHYVDKPRLARSPSMTSCASTTASQHTSPQGYHTPVEEDEHPPLTPRSSLMQQQAPSPYSAVMTVSLEHYLEPQRISFNSPPNSELNPCPPSPDDSFPVFSPPPYDAAPPYAEVVSDTRPIVHRQTSVGPPWMQGSLVTPRQSIISYSSRSPYSHHEYSIFSRRPKYRRKPPKTYKAGRHESIRSGDYYMFDIDDEELDLSDEEKHLAVEDEGLKSDKLNISQLFDSALKTDISTTVQHHSDTEFRRRLSMPLYRRATISGRSQLSAPLSAPPAVDQAKSVTILEKSKSEDSEPKPGTSKDDEELSDISEPEEFTRRQKIINGLMFIWVFIESCMVSLTQFLNKRSKDYRYVMKVLTKEKKIMKEKTNYTEGFRAGSTLIWQPMHSYHSLLAQSHEDSMIDIPSDGTISPSDSYRNDMSAERIVGTAPPQASLSEEKPPISSDDESDTKALATPLPYSSEQDRRKASVLTIPEIRILAPSLERGLDTSLSSRLLLQAETTLDDASEESFIDYIRKRMFDHRQSVQKSSSKQEKQMRIIIDELLSDVLIETNLRASSRSASEASKEEINAVFDEILSRTAFQVDLRASHHSAIEELDMLDNTEMSSYDQPTYVRLLLAIWFTIMSRSELLCYFFVFLNQIKSATFLSLPLPMMVFFWGTLTVPRPSKTFWVTLIAYTEIIVLLKCVFQFNIIDWNKSNAIYPNPFYDAPGIIGIERTKNYALWDLLLLLVIFFHRFMLKSLGLWKTSTTKVACLESGQYKLHENGDLEPLDSSKSVARQKSISFFGKFININTSQEGYSLVINEVTKKPKTLSASRSWDSQYVTAETKLEEKKDEGRIRSVDFVIRPKPLKSEDPIVARAPNSQADSSSGSKSKPTRRSSDLQHLVEETDDVDEGENSKTEPVEGSENIVSVETQEVTKCATVSKTVQASFVKYFSAFRFFFKQILDPSSRVADDVYSLMFLCDFFNFFVILIGYSAFGTQQGDGGVSSYLEDNRVPVLFLLMLILQFMLIIVDRGIFLRKNILAKLLFQFIQIVILHIWLFIVYPIITERKFNSVLPPQLYYMVKCFYLLLSAYQIRSGYPTRILGNFLCKGYTYVNMFLYRAFMIVPFLFELRTVMDWMWTDTSMTVFDWIKMEDIFSHIFLLKCSRHVEDEYPQPRGERKSPTIKYLMGGIILFFIIAIIWFPLVFFSLGSAVGQPNVPYDVTLELRIGPYEPVYQLSAQSNSIYSFSEGDLNRLLATYKRDRNALSFISNYEAADIAAVKLSIDSANIWSISPPDRTRMLKEINSTKPVTVRLGYKVSHKTTKPEDTGVIADSVELILPPSKPDAPNLARANLLAMLVGNESEPVELQYILPKFLKVTSKGTARPIVSLMQEVTSQNVNSKSHRSLNLTLLHDNSTNSSSLDEWWRIRELTDDDNYKYFLKDLPHRDPLSIIIYTFNDKVFSATLSIITGGGIIGLYTTFVFVASRILHGFFTDQCSKIMFEDLPNVDRILQLCLDIYLVREVREFALEEDLFAKLVFLFRSPETLIKWTRPKEELDDDEDPEGEGN